MINKDLVNYFMPYLEDGSDIEALKKNAIKKGWNSVDVEDSLELARYDLQKNPRPKHPKKNDEPIKEEIKEQEKELKKEDKEKNTNPISQEESINHFELFNEKSKKEKIVAKPVRVAPKLDDKNNEITEIQKEQEQIIKRLNEIKEMKNLPNIKQAINGVVESYEIEVDKAKVKVEIRKESAFTKYYLIVPEIGAATASLLNEVRDKLVTATTISMKEITDPSSYNVIKQRFMTDASMLVTEKLPNIDPETREFLIGKLMQDMLGLGEIEFIVNDLNLEEIVIPSSKEPIRVYHKRYGWICTNLTISKEEEIINYSNIVARRVGRQITVLTPLLDAHLVSGDRVNSILYPISTKGNTITIRKFARDPYTIIDLIKSKTCSVEIAVLLWLAIEYEMNILIAGGTASGKTVLLNACMPFIPPNHRIISVEDTRELMLPDFLYWTPLITRLPNPEGKGEVSMLDLLVNSLRMRPDRIILGEMRRQEEAMVLFEAMHTGHSVYATLHADSAAETISRLTHPPLNIPPNLLKAVNLNVIMFRDRRRGIRRILQVAEFDSIEDRAEANIIYRWMPEEDKLIKHSENSRFFESIGKNTGMTEEELNKNLGMKTEIIDWMIKNNIRNLNDFGKIMNLYYINREKLLESVHKNDLSIIKPDEI